MARANIPCRQCHKLHEKQVYADICCLPKRQEERRAMMELACRDLSTATLTALADAGGVKRVLELLTLAAEVQGCTEMTHEDAYHALFKQPTLDNVWLPIRALLKKLGGVE